LYERLFIFYRDRIIRQVYDSGERIDSINRIMDRHNVSRETAKIVLSKLAKEGYIVKKAGKGSFVNYSAELKEAWGIVIPFLTSGIQDLIHHLYLQAMQQDREIRYVLHYNDPEEEMQQVGTMIREAYEAVMIVPNFDESNTAGFYRRLNPGSSRIILLDNTMVGSFFNYVIQSYDLGAKRIFNYLVSKNDRNLLFVRDESWKGRNLVHELVERTLQILMGSLEGTRELFVENGLQRLGREYMQQKNIGGVLCWTDSDAVRLTGRVLGWGFDIPRDISIVSYGNTELTLSGMKQLTVMDCKYPEMARQAAALVFCKECPEETRQVVIEPELVIRET